MSVLFKHLRIHQIFGANTDVGKTILTTALVRASASRGIPVHYLKPVSTGSLEDADDKHVEYYVSTTPDPKRIITRTCLFRYNEPVSPHLAARLEGSIDKAAVPTDAQFVSAVTGHIQQCAQLTSRRAHMYVETAGGVHSPALSGTTQADCYRPLFLPTVLIGDSRLGGISSTISSYEALLLRGYNIDLVLLFRDSYYRNWEYLASYFAEHGVKVLSFDPPPAKLTNPREDREAMYSYYGRLAPDTGSGEIYDALDHLDVKHSKRIEELETMPARTLDTIWWPFAQHGLVKNEADVNVIDSAHSDFFTIYNGHRTSQQNASPDHSLFEPQFDGSASWWTQALGHAQPALTLAAARAAGRYGHVMFPQATHAPALRLAERLVHDGPGKGWAARAFFSDDGSTGMEVALKMALRAFATRHGSTSDKRRKDLGVLGLKGSYHGDTIGAMNACEEGVYTCEWHEAKGYWLDPPTVANRNGRIVIALTPSIVEAAGQGTQAEVVMESLQDAYDVEKRLSSPLARVYKEYLQRTLDRLSKDKSVTLAALVLEPLVMGSGGMIFVDPLFQRVLIDVVRASETHKISPTEWAGLPVILDEVFVGLYRLGMRSTVPLLGAHPDISVHAKILTGGLVPLSVTLASESIFEAFHSDSKLDALLHGHSYTAYPVGCEVANATLDVIEGLATSERWNNARAAWGSGSGANAVWSFWDKGFLDQLSSLPVVSEAMTLGTVLALKIRDDAGGYQSHSAQVLLESLKQCVKDGSASVAPGGAPFGIHYRTLGDVAYFMLSLNTPTPVIQAVQDRIWDALSNVKSM